MYSGKQYLAWIIIAGMTMGFFSSCKIRYAFNDGNFPDEMKTVSIRDFRNQAPLAIPTLSQTFTESLKDIFLQQSPLTLVSKDGDIRFDGDIMDYRTKPLAIQGNETAALNRLSITVNVRFSNTLDDSKSFEQSFTRYADYDSSENLTDVEDQLIKEITEQLVQDIFNKSVSDW